MPDLATWISLGMSGIAVGIAIRTERRVSHDRAARPRLGLAFRPSNFPTDDDGVIALEGTSAWVNVAVTITNDGDKAAGETQIEAWIPRFVDSITARWMDDGESYGDRKWKWMPDPSVKLSDGLGNEFDTLRLVRAVDSVPQMGRSLELRVQCEIPVKGVGAIPLRVRVKTDGSDADAQYLVRLRRTA